MLNSVIQFAILAVFAAASTLTSGQESALKNLFIDSRVTAHETDLEHVITNVVPSIMSDPKSHHSLFARLYQERCLELEPECGVDLYEVCPVKMTTEFEVPVDAPIKDAGCFFLFPPGALRTALKNAFAKQVKEKSLGSQFASIIDQVPEFHVPFAPLLAEVAEYFAVHIFTDVNHALSSMPLFADVLNYTDSVSSKLQVAVLSLLPTIPKTALYKHFLDLFVARLYCAQPKEAAKVMGIVNGVVWEMMQTKKCFFGSYYQDEEGVFKRVTSNEEFFSVVVQVIVRNNPMVVLSNLESLQLSHIEPILPVILKPFLDGVEGKLLCGDVHVKQSLSKVDMNILLNLTNLSKSDWRYHHYKRVLSLSNSSQEDNNYNVPFDSAAKAVYNYGAIIHPAFSVDLQALLPPFPASLSTSFRQITHSASILNPVKFLTCLTSAIPEDVFQATVSRFMAGKGPLFSGKERKLVKWILSVEGVSCKKSQKPIGYFKSQPEKNMTYQQKYLIHSVVFRQGPFRWSTADQRLNDYILACESVARLFYPFYVQKLFTVVQHVDENGSTVRNFEELFMCPFVDKAWLLEHYGNIHVGDINDPTNVHRLHQKGNQKLQIQSLIQFIKECTLFSRVYHYDEYMIYTQSNNLRIRVVELLVSMIQEGYNEQAIFVAECFGSVKDKVLKTLGLDPSRLALNTVSLISKKREYLWKKCSEIVDITCRFANHSEFDDFMNLFLRVPSFEAEEMIFENVQDLLFYGDPRLCSLLKSNVGEKIVQRLWSRCIKKDPLTTSIFAKTATAIFRDFTMELKLKMINHVMSMISFEQELENFFQFAYSENSSELTCIYDLQDRQSVCMAFKRFIIRCCLQLPDNRRDRKVKFYLKLCGRVLGKGEKELKEFLIENFGDFVPMDLIEKSLDMSD